jgi:hypothetical protein
MVGNGDSDLGVDFVPDARLSEVNPETSVSTDAADDLGGVPAPSSVWSSGVPGIIAGTGSAAELLSDDVEVRDESELPLSLEPLRLLTDESLEALVSSEDSGDWSDASTSSGTSFGLVGTSTAGSNGGDVAPLFATPDLDDALGDDAGDTTATRSETSTFCSDRVEAVDSDDALEMVESDDDDDFDDTDRSSSSPSSSSSPFVLVTSSFSESLRGSLVRDFSLLGLSDDDRLFSAVSIVSATVSTPLPPCSPPDAWLLRSSDDDEDDDDEDDDLLDAVLPLEDEELELLLLDDDAEVASLFTETSSVVVSVGSGSSTSRLVDDSNGCGGGFSVSVSSSDCLDVSLEEEEELLLLLLLLLLDADDEEDDDEELEED